MSKKYLLILVLIFTGGISPFSFAEEKQFLLGSSCGFKGNVHFEFNQPVKDFHVELKDHVFKKDWKPSEGDFAIDYIEFEQVFEDEN